jgi:hypothetical protein
MATVTQPRQAWNRAETNRRVRHPLQKLRGYIRSYVTLEGLSVFVLYLAIWFWAGLILDFGVFKVFAFDWVEELPRTISVGSFQIVRTSVLVLLLAGLVAVVAFKVILRLMREFRDPALALVMERRFPQQLGDRLITAVEMADPRLAEKYGHSQTMVDQTIQDAADRVDKLPVTGVFNWKRLYLYGLLVLGLTVGLYALAGGAYCLIAQEEPAKYLYRSRDVAAIWVERNIFLQDSLWPRSAYLEILRFQGSKNDPDEMHLSDSNPSTPLTVRGIKWVIADGTAPKGWRALRWKDLPEVLGHEPEVPLPDDWTSWTIDPDDLDPNVPGQLVPESWRGKSIAYVQNDLTFPGLRGQELMAGSNCLPAHGSPLTLLHSGLALTMNRDKLLLAQESLTGAGAMGAGLAPLAPGPFLALNSVAAGKSEAHPAILPRVQVALERAGSLAALKKSLFRWREWTLDRIEQQVSNPNIRDLLREQNRAPKAAFDRVFEELDALVEEGHMERTLRRLDVPKQITLKIYYGKGKTTTKDFAQGMDNKYQDNVALEESARIQFQGADYYTPEKRIVLVPRPKVATIITNRSEPAYIFYRLQGFVETEAKEPDPEKRLLLKERDRQAQLELRGKRQQYLNVPAKISEQVCYIEVPISGDLDLIAEANEDLKEEVLVIAAAKGDDDKAPGGAVEGTRARFLKEGDGLSKRKFALSFKNLTRVHDLKLKLVNEDGVEGSCQVVITPKADDHPRVDVQMIRNVFRMKENVGYMVTPVAEVPFGGVVSDDRGLSRVEWRFKVGPYLEELNTIKLETMLTTLPLTPGGFSRHLMAGSYLTILLKQMTAAEGDGGKKSVPVMTALQIAPGGFSQHLMAAAYLPWLAGEINKIDDVESRLMQKFIDEIKRRKKTEKTAEQMLEMLTQQPPKDGPLTQINLRTEDDFFSFEEYLGHLKASGENVFQKRYLVELWVAATDNNVEADQPVVTEDKKRFTFLVVGENELLAEIFREEEKLRGTLDQIYLKLKTAKSRLDTQVMEHLRDGPLVLAGDIGADELRRKMTRTEEVRDDIASSYRDIGGILAAFNRILVELEKNKITKALTHMRDEICNPLQDMQDKKTGEFRVAEDAAAALVAALERDMKASLAKAAIPGSDKNDRVRKGQEAQKRLDDLIKRLEKVLAQIRETVGKDQLVRLLVEIEERQRKQTELLEAQRKYLVEELIKGATGKTE